MIDIQQPKASDMRLRRIIWRRKPAPADVELMRSETFFGPSCFEKNNVWWFIQGDNPLCHAPTPDGWCRIN